MSKSIIGDQLWAEMTEVQKAETVRSGRATLKQLTEGLLDGSDELRLHCRAYLARTDGLLENISPDTSSRPTPSEETKSRLAVIEKETSSKRKKQNVLGTRKPKPRFGLPEGFCPRAQRYGRSVLLEDNVYRLSNGQEFIPKYPTGTLGKFSHLYALLTVEQFEGGRRGSVYIRADGRIFDYGVDHADPTRDLFDTGYTIHDLERTGRYASKSGSEKIQDGGSKPRRLAHAG